MSRTCQVTGKGPLFGNRVSHSKRRTRHRQSANIQNRRFWSPERDCFIRLKVSTSGLRVINRRGLETVLSDLEKQGHKF
jgi:large subunit ribosomal protein L28